MNERVNEILDALAGRGSVSLEHSVNFENAITIIALLFLAIFLGIILGALVVKQIA